MYVNIKQSHITIVKNTVHNSMSTVRSCDNELAHLTAAWMTCGLLGILISFV